MSTITRRAALTGTAAGAAAIVAGTGPAFASEHLDAELRRLWAEYQHHVERYEAARVACAPARAAFDAEYPPCPPDVLPGRHWEAQQPLWHKHGLEELWGEVERQSDKLWELVGAIHATPAEGLFGIGVKLAARLPDHQDEDTVEGVGAALPTSSG
jgi:hypothetical protein